MLARRLSARPSREDLEETNILRERGADPVRTVAPTLGRRGRASALGYAPGAPALPRPTAYALPRPRTPADRLKPYARAFSRFLAQVRVVDVLCEHTYK